MKVEEKQLEIVIASFKYVFSLSPNFHFYCFLFFDSCLFGNQLLTGMNECSMSICKM